MYIFFLFLFCGCVCICFFVWFCQYSLAFTICPRVLSARFCFFSFSIVFSTCYHWWICFWVWLLSSFFLFFPYLKFFFIFNYFFIFFFNDTATTEIYTLSLHDALPIWQNPRTNGKSKAILTKSHKEAYTYTLTKRKRKKYIYIYI